MEDIKRRFFNEIAARLSAAAESDAKTEMIEELAENLSRRYEDMTASGMDQYEAFDRAMEELGDADELVEYLNSLDPDRSNPEIGGDWGNMDELWQTVSAAGKIAMDAAGKAVQKAMDYAQKLKDQADLPKHGKVDVNVDWNGKHYERSVQFGKPDGEGRDIDPGEIRSIDIENWDGDVSIRVDPDENAPIRVNGNVDLDMDKLNITVTEDGVWKLRPVRTASVDFFFRHGWAAPDLLVTVPARFWKSIRIATASGDADMRGELDIGELYVKTASGDFNGSFGSCLQARLQSASGDLETRGRVGTLQAETASGDIDHKGSVEHARLKSVSGDIYVEGQKISEVKANSVSGDIELTGEMEAVTAGTMSGDIRVETGAQPQSMDLSSKSGDVEARIPASGSFSVNLRSTSGSVNYDFPMEWPGGGSSGDGPRYSLTSVSGDVTLRPY